MAKSLGSLWVSLGLNTAKFDDGLTRSNRKAKGSADMMKKSFGSVSKSVMKLGAAALALAGPAALGALTVKSLAAVDANAKMADSIGITTVKLVALQKAAELTGGSAEGMNKSLQMMQKNISDAARGTGEAKVAFEELGISTKDLIDLTPDQQFAVISEAMSGMTNEADRTAYAMKVFGEQGVKLINTMKMTPEQLALVEQQMIAVGKAVDRFDSAKIEQSNDAFSMMGDVVEGVGNRIAVGLSPYIQKFSQDMFDSAVNSEGWKNVISKSIDYLITGLGWLGNAWRGQQVVIAVIRSAVIGFVAGAMESIQGLISLLNRIPGVNIQLSESFNAMTESMQTSFAESKQDIVDLIDAPLPSDSLRAWADEAEAQSNRAAAAFVKAQEIQKSAGSKAVDAEKKKNDKIVSDSLKGAKEMFGITKAQNIATAAANIPTAVSGAYKVGAGIGGPLLGIAFGAAAGAFEAKKMADIAGVSFGGGGGGGGGGGSVPPSTPPPSIAISDDAAAASPAKAKGTTVTINLGDDDMPVSKGYVRRLLEGINDEIRDGATIDGITVG